MQTTEYIQNTECRIQNAEYRMQNTEYIQNTECRMQNAEYTIFIVYDNIDICFSTAYTFDKVTRKTNQNTQEVKMNAI